MKVARLMVVFLGLLASSASAQYYQAADKAPQIQVSGEAAIYVPPNRVIVSLGVETSNVDMLVARDANASIMARIMLALKAAGIADRDVQTDRYTIDPVRKNIGSNRYQIDFYDVRNAIVVTLADPQKLDNLMTSVLEAGATSIHGVDFQTTELRKHRDEARDLALKAAREKATRMAATLGQRVGPPLQVYEGGNHGYWGWSRWGGRHAMSQNVGIDAGDQSGGVLDTLALGKIAIRANVSVTFALEDAPEAGTSAPTAR